MQESLETVGPGKALLAQPCTVTSWEQALLRAAKLAHARLLTPDVVPFERMRPGKGQACYTRPHHAPLPAPCAVPRCHHSMGTGSGSLLRASKPSWPHFPLPNSGSSECMRPRLQSRTQPMRCRSWTQAASQAAGSLSTRSLGLASRGQHEQTFPAPPHGASSISPASRSSPHPNTRPAERTGAHTPRHRPSTEKQQQQPGAD